jgi:DNA-binding transcriptional ArsR family regulator
MTITQKAVTSPDALKALAHPVRMDILEALVVEGPLTASQLGERLDQNPSNCSWHLRKLADHGFVRAVTGNHGRRRPWQAVAEGLTWGEDDPDARTTRAADALSDLMLQREIQRLRAARAGRANETAAWREATNSVGSLVYLTAAEATALITSIHDTLLGFEVDLHHDPAAMPAGSLLVSVVAWVTPT